MCCFYTPHSKTVSLTSLLSAQPQKQLCSTQGWATQLLFPHRPLGRFLQAPIGKTLSSAGSRPRRGCQAIFFVSALLTILKQGVACHSPSLQAAISRDTKQLWPAGTESLLDPGAHRQTGTAPASCYPSSAWPCLRVLQEQASRGQRGSWVPCRLTLAQTAPGMSHCLNMTMRELLHHRDKMA